VTGVASPRINDLLSDLSDQPRILAAWSPIRRLARGVFRDEAKADRAVMEQIWLLDSRQLDGLVICRLKGVAVSVRHYSTRPWRRYWTRYFLSSGLSFEMIGFASWGVVSCKNWREVPSAMTTFM